MRGMFFSIKANTGLKLIVSTLMFLLTGCSWIDSKGVKHSLIIGLGYVSQVDVTGIKATDFGVAGISLDQGISLGLMKKTSVEINPNTAPNAIVSVKATPFSLTVRNIDQKENLLPIDEEKY